MKDTVDSMLFPLGSPTQGEASCYDRRALKWLCGKVHLARNGDLPTIRKETDFLPVVLRVSPLGVGLVVPVHPSGDAAPAVETLRLEPPTKLFLCT